MLALANEFRCSALAPTPRSSEAHQRVDNCKVRGPERNGDLLQPLAKCVAKRSPGRSVSTTRL